MSLEIALLGLFIGFLVGLTGVGGAALLTPILVMTGVNPTVAVGTDLTYNAITKLFGSIQHLRQKTVNLRLVKYLAIGSVPAAALAVCVLHFFKPIYEHQETIVKHALGVVLIIVSVATVFKLIFDKHLQNSVWQTKSFEKKAALTIAIGAVLGFIVGMTSIGSGSLFALAMMYLYRLGSSELVGTDIAHAFILVTVAGILNAGFGNVDYVLCANMLLGSIPGVVLGSTLSARVPAKPLRALMAALIFISGIKLI